MMFNHLQEIEKNFLKNNENLTKSDSPKFYELKWAQLNQMLVPFSSDSFSNGGYNHLIGNFWFDLIFIFINFTSFLILMKNKPIAVFIYAQLLSPIIITIGALDLTFNLSVFLLSLITRSLSSIFHMVNEAINGYDNEAINGYAPDSLRL